MLKTLEVFGQYSLYYQQKEVTQFFKENPGYSQMPSEFDDLLSQVGFSHISTYLQIDQEVTKGSSKRTPAFVWTLVNIYPFHPQTIKLRLRLLQRRRENNEAEEKYKKEKESFLQFV